MAGIEAFARMALAKETVKGTPVAPARRMYGVVAGNFELGDDWNFAEEENRGTKTRISRAPTQVREAPTFKYITADGVSYDDIIVLFDAGVRGGQAFTGAGADKSVVQAIVNTATGTQDSFTWDIGDDVQNWRLQYCMPTRIMMSAQLGGKTQVESDWFAQRAIKTVAATPAENTGVKIPSELWTVKFAATFAGLAGASISTNFLRSWSLELMTGLSPRFYLDGNLFLGQHVESSVVGTITMESESTAFAVSEIVDKYRAGTLDFIRMKATGPTLGASNYSSQLDIPVYWDKPQILSAVDDGVNLYSWTGRVAYDVTAAKSLESTTVQSLTAFP